MKRKIIVIGGLAAGPSAAAKAKRVNPDSEVILYEQNEYISYGICEIPFFISGEVQNPNDLIIFSPEKFQREKNVSAYIHRKVETIIPRNREILVRNFTNGKTNRENYDKLIIATGNSPKLLGIKGENARNVFHIKKLDEAFALRKFILEEKPRSAVVIGAGFIGLEMTDALNKIGIEVSLVHQNELPLSVLEKSSSEIVRNAILKKGIHYYLNSNVEWFGIGASQNVVAVGLKSKTIETDLVIVAIGVTPNSALAKEAGISIGKFGGISISDRMNVIGADNIFAAGDCCEIKNIITKKPMYVSLATTASKTAKVAGENAAGGNAQYKGAIRAIGIKFADIEIAQVGLSTKEAARHQFQYDVTQITSNSKVSMMPNASELFFTVISEKRSGKLLGANVIGKEGAVQRANVFAAAIRHNLNLNDIAELDLIYSPPFSPLWDGIIQSGISGSKK